MIVDSFLDTNVLIYAALGGSTVPSKKQIARQLIESTRFGTSTQVMQEFYVNAIRKSDRPLSAETALEWVEMLAERPCAVVDRNAIVSAIEHSKRYQISYWDASILLSAEALGADILYSEDLNHNQLYGAVRVVNPFLSS